MSWWGMDFDGPHGLREISWNNESCFYGSDLPIRPFTARIHPDCPNILEVVDAEDRCVVNAWRPGYKANVTKQLEFDDENLEPALQFMLDLCEAKFS